MAITSKGRMYDMGVRSSVMEVMRVCIRMYEKTKEKKWFDEAMYFGEESKRLKTRIETHDYKNEDESYRVVDDIDRRWNSLSSPHKPLPRKTSPKYKDAYQRAFHVLDQVLKKTPPAKTIKLTKKRTSGNTYLKRVMHRWMIWGWTMMMMVIH